MALIPTIGKQPLKKPQTTEDILNTQYENLTARLGAVGAPVDDRGIVGKLLNLEQDQGFLMDIFEVIDRPGQAVKGFLSPTEGDDPFTGFAKGLAGMTDRTGTDFLVDTGLMSETELEKSSGAAKFALNVGIDMLTDPLTYIPAGSIKKVLDKLNPFEIGAPYEILLGQVDNIKVAKQAELDTLVQTLTAANPGKKSKTILNEAKKQLGIIDGTKVKALAKEKNKLIQATKKKIDDLKAAGYNDKQIAKLTEKQGGLGWREWEAMSIDDINTKLLAKADELKVAGNQLVVTSTSKASAPGMYDLEILLDLGNDTFATVSRVQVKSMAKGAARGGSSVLKTSKAGVLQFADNVQLTPDIQKLIQTKYSNMTVTVTKNGTQTKATIAEVIDDMVKGAEGTQKGYTFNTKNMSADDLNTLEQAAKDVMNAQYGANDFVYIIGKDGVGDMFRWGDVQDSIKYKVSLQTSPSARGKGPIQTRLQIGLELDRLPIEKSAFDTLYDEVFDITKIQGTTLRKVGFFDWAATKDYAISPFAKQVVQIKQRIGRGFNAFFGVGDESVATFRQLSAQSQTIVYDNHRRLTMISEEVIRRNPNGEKIIQNLLESGAQIVDGKVVVNTTYLNMNDVLNLFDTGWLRNGQNEIPLAVYGASARFKQTTATNILTNTNNAIRSASGIDDAFKLVQKGDDWFLQLDNISPDDLRQVMKSKEFMAIATDPNTGKLSFGKYRPSDEELDFYLNNSDLIDQYRRIDADINDIFNKELGIQNIPNAIKTTNGYVRHTLSNQGAAWLKANQPLAYSKYMREGIDFLANRKYLGMGTDVNRAMKLMYDIDFDFFDVNITNSLADLLRVGVTKNESGKVLKIILDGADNANRPLFQVIDNTQAASLGEGYEYVTDFAQEYSKLYTNLAPDAQKSLTNYLNAAGFGSDKAIAIHKTAHSMLKKIEKAYVEVPQLLKDYDNMITWWKGLNLITPTFHLNSFFGNSTNMYLVGMGVLDQGTYLTKSSSYLRQQQRILQQLDSAIIAGANRADALKGLAKADQEIYEVLLGFMESGASMKGRGAKDLGSIGRTLEQGGQKGLYQELLQANFNLAENIDEVQRFALYMWAYEKEIRTLGGAVDDIARQGARTRAANKVFESMFDYSHFSQFEQDVMKRMIPFYTFMKNNLTFQMRNLINNPQQYGKLGRAYNYYVSDIAGISAEDMPEYARDNMWLPIPITLNRGDKETITFLKASLPPAEFAELIESRFARGVSSLTVPLKLPIELAMNRDIFTGAEIKEFAGEKDQMAPGTGVATFLRDEQGMVAFSSDPTVQKIANDLGFRVPARYISTALGLMDSALGYKEPQAAFAEALNSLGVISIKDAEAVRVTNLYQALEKYREAEKRWEQSTGIDLPSKAALGLP